MVYSDIGALDSDGAIVGLIALRGWTGELPAFYWAQSYGGNVEPVLAALVFLVAGASELTLRLLPVALSLIVVLLTYRLGLATVGRRGALVGAALVSAGPGAFLWWSVHPGPYWACLALVLGAVVLLVEAPEQLSPRRAGAIGALSGLAWWANPLSAAVVVPVALTRLGPLRTGRTPLWLGAGAAAGAAPWLAATAARGLVTLRGPRAGVLGSSYLDHLEGFFRIVQPMALGLRVPYTGDWLPGRLVAVAVYLGLLALFAVALVRWARGRDGSPAAPLLAVAAAYPFLYAVPSASWYVVEPRYLLFLSPFVALLLGWAATAWRPTRRAVATVALLAAWTASSVVIVHRGRFPAPNAADVPVPADIGPLVRGLEAEGARFAFGHYWLSYRVTFATEERVIVAPTIVSRYRRYDELVRAQPSPPYAFVRASPVLAEFLAALDQRGISWRVEGYGRFAIVFPAERVLPEELPMVFDG